MVISATVGYAGLIYASIPMMCYFAFVRNPVQHYSPFLNPKNPDSRYGGRMKKRLSRYDALVVKYAPTSNHWEADPAPYSDSLYLSMRFPNMLNLGIGVGCERGDYVTKTDSDLYRGANSKLCPEEWQALGVNFELDNSNPGFPVQRVKYDKDGDRVLFDSEKWNKNIYNVKVMSSPTHHGGPFRKSTTTYLHGYKLALMYITPFNSTVFKFLKASLFCTPQDFLSCNS